MSKKEPILVRCQCGRGPFPVRTFPLNCRCGRIYYEPDKPVTPPPSMLQRGRNYIKAWYTWKQAGSPRRTTEEVERLATICKTCEYFNKDHQICNHRLCGCNVTGKKAWWGSKLRWATEHCPVNKWGIDAAILTCPRDDKTKHKSLESIRAGGYRNVMLYEDPGKNLGPLGNFLKAAQDGIRLIFQDDAILSAHAKPYIERTAPDDWDVLSLYTPAPNDHYKKTNNPHWHIAPSNPAQCYGALGYLLSDRCLALLQKDPPDTGRHGKGADVRFARWLRKKGLKMYLHSPSLIKHIGHTSTVNQMPITHSRQCRFWIKDCDDPEDVEGFRVRPPREVRLHSQPVQSG
jgi:hypothetical protein